MVNHQDKSESTKYTEGQDQDQSPENIKDKIQKMTCHMESIHGRMVNKLKSKEDT